MSELESRKVPPAQSASPQSGLPTPNQGADPQLSPLQPMPTEKAKLVWEQWKYRHNFFWKAFYTVTVTTAVVSTIPLFKSDVISSLGAVSLAFPLLGLGLGTFGRSLLDAEYKRLLVVGDSYDTAPWSYGTKRTPPYRTAVGRPVGELLRPAMAAALIGLPIASFLANLLVLLK